MKSALVKTVTTLDNFPLDRKIHASRMLNREQVHALMLRDKKEGSGTTYEPSLCFVVNMAENTDQIPQLFRLLNRLKVADYFNDFFAHFNSNEELLNDLFIKWTDDANFLADNVEEGIDVTDAIRDQFNEIKSLWTSLSRFYPTFDQSKPFSIFKSLLDKLKSEQDPVSVAIVRNSHWTGFSVHNSKVMFADSFNGFFSDKTDPSLGNIAECFKEFSTQFSYQIRDVTSPLNNYLNSNKRPEIPLAALSRLRANILDNINVSNQVGFSDVVPVDDINNILQQFVTKQLERLILELNEHISQKTSDSNDPFDPNLPKNPDSTLKPDNENFDRELYNGFFNKIYTVLQEFKTVLDSPFFNEHTITDYNNICQSFRDHRKNGWQDLEWDSIFDSEKSIISLDMVLKAKSKSEVAKTIFDYFGNGNNLKVIEAYFSQQSDGWSCGYHTVANIRMQRQALYDGNDSPLYHFHCHSNDIASTISAEVVDPENAPVLSVAKIKALVDAAMQPDSKMNNSIIPYGMDTKSFMMYLVLGAILGFSATMMSIQTMLIISTVSVLLYALTIEDSDELAPNKSLNKAWGSEDFGHTVYEVESDNLISKPEQSKGNNLAKLLTFGP